MADVNAYLISVAALITAGSGAFAVFRSRPDSSGSVTALARDLAAKDQKIADLQVALDECEQRERTPPARKRR